MIFQVGVYSINHTCTIFTLRFYIKSWNLLRNLLNLSLPKKTNWISTTFKMFSEGGSRIDNAYLPKVLTNQCPDGLRIRTSANEVKILVLYTGQSFSPGAFHEQGSPGGEKMTIFKSHFYHDIFTQMAPLGSRARGDIAILARAQLNHLHTQLILI